MTISFHEAPSNREDWTIQFYASDEETGEAIDFSGATINFVLRDSGGCQRLAASTDDGTITTPSAGYVDIALTEAQMATLCAGSYPFGCNYEINGVTAQLFVGTASIYDGVVNA